MTVFEPPSGDYLYAEQRDCALQICAHRVETSFLIAGRKCWMAAQDGGVNQIAAA
jgi:hypothetical protein